MLKRVNLVPQKPLADRIKGLIPLVLLSFGLLLLIFFSLRLKGLNSDLEAITRQIKTTEQQTEGLRLLKDKINQNQGALITKTEEKKDRQQRVAILSKLKGNKYHFARPLAIIAQVIPPTIRCNTISFTSNDGTLTGTALDYDDLVQMVTSLQQQALFAQVALTVTDRDNSQKLERIAFTITVELS